MNKADTSREFNPAAAQEKRQRKIAIEEFSVSYMNRTKWRETLDSLDGVTTSGFRVKFIDDAKVWNADWLISPSAGYIEGGECGPMRFAAIEWLEILFAPAPAGETDRAELRRRFQARHIPFTEDDDLFRIQGYGGGLERQDT